MPFVYVREILAHYTHRKVGQDPAVMIGSKEIYEPLSRMVFWEAMQEETVLPNSQKEDTQEL